ncbi:MAG: response regulator [Anaerolineae bacterium]|nr:response regulator [Anaerolineae bacterium]MCI0608433.1 response regulator [Anaerolineae bacterium]
MDIQQGYVLVVDDVPDILELLDTTLKFKGYRVVTAHNGVEALDAIEQEHPTLIIADILMPRMDGFSLVHRLRLNPQTRDIPVIFLSATYVTPEDKDFALTIGVTRFIEKPVDIESFLPMIANFIKQGEPAAHKPINELDFYQGYRKRLEAKLKQKNVQITRDSHLLENLSEAERHSFEASLHQTISERDEIQKLLAQIRERLENSGKTE